MTISYTKECATVSLGNFARLLFRWRGSIYKIIFKETLIFITIYYFINIIYWHALSDGQKLLFEDVAQYFTVETLQIPLTFLMGFFVNQVYSRWTSNFKGIIWVDSAMIRIANSIEGNDERGKVLRRTLARYINLSCVIVLRDISTAVKKRFPTWDHLVKTGIMTESELDEYQTTAKKHPDVYVYFLPLQWAGNLAMKAAKEGRVSCNLALVKMIRDILQIRGDIGGLLSYSWISLPLVYTQVVTIATHSFFITNIIARQVTNAAVDRDIETYFPANLFVEFLFCMGCLKVAEVLMVPFGEDDDDFEINYILERNLQISYLMVDDLAGKVPLLVRDKHWSEEEATIPQTLASMGLKRQPFTPSTADLKIPERLCSVVRKPSNMSGISRLNSTASAWKK